ncbi:MAG: MBL fold metallo-hydrolase [Clostridia bacterium]|nr:MBL fold metallo-hydrolase [Clostridia bacterium]
MIAKKTMLEENFILYNFQAAKKNELGINICALLDGDYAMLIDSGYREHCKDVLEDLAKDGISVIKVLPSHFHPDHVEGILLIDEPIVFGNNFATETLEKFYSKEVVRVMSPSKTISDGDKLQFGKFTLSFEYAPGHSDCSILIDINDKYLHIGDIYFKSDDGVDVLPYVLWAGVEEHIKSLERILKYKDRSYLISHGNCPLEIEEMKEGVANRITYLKTLLDSCNTVSAEDAISECSKPFNFLHWRKEVI